MPSRSAEWAGPAARRFVGQNLPERSAWPERGSPQVRVLSLSFSSCHRNELEHAGRYGHANTTNPVRPERVGAHIDAGRVTNRSKISRIERTQDDGRKLPPLFRREVFTD